MALSHWVNGVLLSDWVIGLLGYLGLLSLLHLFGFSGLFSGGVLFSLFRFIVDGEDFQFISLLDQFPFNIASHLFRLTLI